MIFLEQPDSHNLVTEADLSQLISTLGSFDRALTSLLTAGRGTQKEAKSWLLNAIAGLGIQDAGAKRRKLGQFLPGGSAFERQKHEEYGRQLLRGLFDDKPQKVSLLISQEPSALKRFFKHDPTHVRLWFGHFSMGGLGEFRHGAYALARFALLHRDEVWRHLVWGGKHPQAPVAVAQKTHYFCELDVPGTVERLLEEWPPFWESEELRESLLGGQLLALAPDYWAQELYAWLKEYSPRSDKLFGIVCDYLETGCDWRRLCGRLLPLLGPSDLLSFANGLLDDMPFPSQPPPMLGTAAAATAATAAAAAAAAAAGRTSDATGGAAGAGQGPAQSGAWLVFKGARWGSLEQLTVWAAVVCNLRLLGRLAREEENGDELQEMLEIVDQLAARETPALHWHLRCQLAQQARQQAQQQTQQAQAQRHNDRTQQQGHTAATAGEGGSSSGGSGSGTTAGLSIHTFLLLHLWALYLCLCQLFTSTPAAVAAGGSQAHGSAEEQFQQLASQTGINCKPFVAGTARLGTAGSDAAVAAGDMGAGAEAGSGEEEVVGHWSGKKQRRKREREGRRGSKRVVKKKRRQRSASRDRGKKKHRQRSASRDRGKKRKRRGKDKGRNHKRRRRRGSGDSGSSDSGSASKASSSSSSSSSSNDSGSSEGEGEEGRGDRGRPSLVKGDWERESQLGRALIASGQQQGSSRAASGGQALWAVQLPGGREVILTALELAELAVERAAWVYASWLFKG